MLILILTPIVIFFGGMIAFVSITVHGIVVKDADKILESYGDALSKDIRLDFELAMNSADTLSRSFEGMFENLTVLTRSDAMIMLQKRLEQNPQFFGTWTYWEKNAFDGRDQANANRMGHDATGQFIPYWTRSESGYQVRPLDLTEQFQEQVNQVMKSGKNTILEPYWYEIDGQSKLFISVISPVVHNGKSIGLTGIDLALDGLGARLGEYSFYDSGFASLITNSGMIAFHPHSSLLGVDYFESPAMANQEGSDLVREAVRAGEQVRIEGQSDVVEKQVYRLFTPVYIGDTAAPWSAIVVVPVHEVVKQAQLLTTTILLVSAAVIIVLALVVVFVANIVVRPIRTAVLHGQEMAAGDFTRAMPAKFSGRKDEIGDLARIFVSIGDSMRDVIGKIQDSARGVLESSETMHSASQQSADAASEVAVSIEQVARSAENQMQGAEESAKSMEDMTQGVQSVAGAASSLSESANDMTDRANAGQRSVQNAVEQMNRIQNEAGTTKTVIEQLQVSAHQIESIVSLITDISEQTNLLALNAAIEAARAGEAGRGFAVVANEVRKLADETRGSASDIQQLVAGIQADAVRATDSMNANETEVNRGIERIVEVGAAFDQILHSIQSVAQDIVEMSAVAEEMSAGAEEIAATSEEIASSAESSFEHTQQVAAAAEEQLAQMEEMTQTSESLQQLATELENLVDRFKVS